MASRSRACTTATGRRVIWERSASSDNSPGEEHRRAANAYLIWPLALANIIRFTAGDSQWYRIHSRQALVLGITASIGFAVLLALPLIAVIAIPNLSTSATIGVYGVGLLLDSIVTIGYIVTAIRYARRVSRGELFVIPLVTPIADALFGSRTP